MLLPLAARGLLNHLGVEYDRAAEQATREQEARREKEIYEQLRTVDRSLEGGFDAVDSEKGLRVLAQLTEEFEHWQAPQYRRDPGDPLAMVLVPQLVIETYRRGISALGDALALGGETKHSDAERLKREARPSSTNSAARSCQSWRARRKPCSPPTAIVCGASPSSSQAQDKLFFQAELCEAALHRGRIDVVALRSGSSHGSVDGVIQALQKTIEQVKSVQEEIRRLGY